MSETGPESVYHGCLRVAPANHLHRTRNAKHRQSSERSDGLRAQSTTTHAAEEPSITDVLNIATSREARRLHSEPPAQRKKYHESKIIPHQEGKTFKYLDLAGSRHEGPNVPTIRLPRTNKHVVHARGGPHL